MKLSSYTISHFSFQICSVGKSQQQEKFVRLATAVRDYLTSLEGIVLGIEEVYVLDFFDAYSLYTFIIFLNFINDVCRESRLFS